MIVGYHSPLPPARSGVADYAATLLEALRDYVKIAVNPSRPCDVELRHLGNNALHWGIYQSAIERPGAAVLHDAVLHHLFLGSLSEERYLEEFTHNYGEWAASLARDLWRGRSRSAQSPRYFRYPMLRRIGEAGRAVVVHNPAAARLLKDHAPRANVVEIPHLFQPPQPAGPVEVLRLRERLGMQPGAVLFGVFGFLRESKRLAAILRAFREVRRAVPGAALLIAGQYASSDLERALAPLLKAPGVHRAGYLSEPELGLHAAACDVCVNLRYPAAGETSGIATRMMGIGKPVLVTDGEETSRIPEAACIRIDPGPAERDMLQAMMIWLAGDRAARQEIGRRAAAHIAAHHGVRDCARKYFDVLRSAASESAPEQRPIGAH